MEYHTQYVSDHVASSRAYMFAKYVCRLGLSKVDSRQTNTNQQISDIDSLVDDVVSSSCWQASS